VKDTFSYLVQRSDVLPEPAREPAYPPLANSYSYGEQADLRQYWRTLRKHLWPLLSVPVVLVALTGIRDLLAPRLYTAKATILIKNNAPQVYAYTSVDSSSGPDGAATSSQWKVDNKTEYTLLQARSLAERVIRIEGLIANPFFPNTRAGAPSDATAEGGDEILSDDPEAGQVPSALMNRYFLDLKIAPIDETELVAVGFTTPNAVLSARLANAHVREFIRQGIELNAQNSEQATQFLQKKLSQLKQQVEESELALNNYRRDKGIVPGLISVDGSQDVVLGRLDKISEQAQQAHLKNLNLETQIALIDQGHADALPDVIDNKIVQTLKENLDAFQVQYASMSGEYKPDYPPMAELTEKMTETRGALKREIEAIVAGTRVQYMASLKDEEALGQELKREKEFALGLNDAGVKYAILQREADTNKELYNAVLKRMKDVEVTADLHASNVSIVDKATVPQTPSSPQTARDLVVAALLGLMGGIGLAFLLERHDDTFKDSEEVESYLRIPQLGTIPDFNRLGGPIYGGGTGLIFNGPAQSKYAVPIATAYGLHSPIGEAYRMVRTGLLLSRAGAPPKTALISSAIPGEGKTTTAANLAVVLASTGRRLLLIDADLRRPHCHNLFGMGNLHGLTEALTGVRKVEEGIQPTGFDNLDLLSSGEIPPNPSELLGSDKMREILAHLAGRYDCVVIDSAPITAVTDAVILSNMVDGVVLVANRWTARQQVRNALSRIEYARAKVFGIVLNQVDLNHFGYQGYKSHYYLYQPGGKNGGAASVTN
jgi:polysaccharide biosynthesis transport protein